MLLFQKSIVFGHDEDRARQGRTDPESYGQTAYQHRDPLASGVVDKGGDARGVDDDEDERQRKTHRYPHGGVSDQPQQPRGGQQPRWFLREVSGSIGADDSPLKE